MIGQLQLLVLGVPQIRVDGRDARLPTRKALALLTFLAIDSGPHSRDHIAALLWPDAVPENSRAALRNTLTYLRALLGEEVRPPVSSARETIDPSVPSMMQPRLRSGRDYLDLRLCPGDDVDLCDLRRAEHAAQDLRHTSHDDEVLAVLTASAARYRGEFLAGFSLDDAPEFEAWIVRQREINRVRVAIILDRLAALQLDRGESVRALAVASRWVALDTLNEAAHRRVIQAHLAAGDRSGALQAYNTCRRTLATELGVEPDPKTEAFGRRARDAGQSDASFDGPMASWRAMQPGRLSPMSIEWPLVGRSNEFAMLVDAFDHARRGETAVVIIEGEAGIGKTRLLTEFIRWADAQGTDVIGAHAYEGGPIPYQVVVDAFGPRLERDNAPDDLLPTVWLEELCRLFPELRDRYPDLQMPVAGDSAAQTRLFEAVSRLGQALARRATLVLFLDDLHWVDRASRDLLRYAVRQWKKRQASILLVITLRSEALATSRDVVDWLVDMRRDLEVSEIELSPLTFDDIRRAVEACGVREPVQSLATWLFAETRGQPLYAVESMRALVDQGILQRVDHVDGASEYKNQWPPRR